MSCIPSSTIAALCYAKPSSLNFSALAAELEPLASIKDSSGEMRLDANEDRHNSTP